MNSITFLRHAEVNAWGHLTREGEASAQEACEVLGKYPPFDLAISSNALRCQQTLKIILETLNLDLKPFIIDELQMPQDRFHAYEVIKLLEKYKSSALKDLLKSDASSSFDVYKKEAFLALDEILKQQNPSHVIVLAHGYIINCLGLFFLKKSKELEEIYFAHMQGFRIDFDQSLKLTLLTGL